jgi:hypothetical protein
MKEMTMVNKRGTTYLYLFVGLILCIASILRIYDLGRFGFWWDELYHVIAAKSLLTEGRPFIPLQGDYTRALSFTYIIALFFKFFGINEVAARMPSVIFNLLFILIAFIIIKKWLNQGIALLFVIVISFSPFTLLLARECRMYTLFQLLYFLISYFFFIGIEHGNDKMMIFKKVESRYGINILYLFCSLLFFILSVNIHKLTFNFSVTVFCYATFLFLYECKNKGILNSLNSKYFFIVIFSVACFLFVYVFKRDFLYSMIYTATSIPIWKTYKISNFHYYRYFLSENYPAFFFIYPLSITFMIKDYGKKGFFILSSFIFLYIAHLFIFARQWDRYIFYIFPFFILGSLFLVDKVIKYVWNEINNNFKGRSKIVYIVVIIFGLLSFNVVARPWLPVSRNVYKTTKWSRWESIPQNLIKEIRNGTAITTRQMAYIYYFDEMPDFYMRSISDFKIVHDPRYNIKIIDDIESLKHSFENTKGSLFLVVSPWTFENDIITTPEMRDYILKHCDIIYVGQRKEVKKREDVIIYKRVR